MRNEASEKHMYHGVLTKFVGLLGLIVFLSVLIYSQQTYLTGIGDTLNNVYLPVIQRPRAPLVSCDNSLPQVTFPSEDIFRPIADITTVYGRNDIGTSFVVQGKLIFVQSDDDVNRDSSIEIYDIDNPYAPRRLAVIANAQTAYLREAHSVGYSIQDGRHLVAMQANDGVMIWDFTSVTNPYLLAHLYISDVTNHPYNAGGFWLTWHGDTIYYAAPRVGVFVIDASEPRALRTTGLIKPSTWGGMPAGSIQTLGNYMYVGAGDGKGEGIVVLDIGNPDSPTLIHSTSDVTPQYSMLVNGNYAYVASKDNALTVFDISNPANPVHKGDAPVTGNGGYVTYQDGYAYIGATLTVSKIDVKNPANPLLVGSGFGGGKLRDHDFATVLGNMIMVGDDHNFGGYLIPHQSQPDTTPPAVNRVVPAPDSTLQNQRMAIGISFSDQINLTTVTSKTVIIRPLGGEALAGTYTYQTNLLNFQPDQALQPNTTYEIVVPDLGVSDLSCNHTDRSFVSKFSTGSFVDELPSCSVGQNVTASAVGDEVVFVGSLLSGFSSNVTWQWEFGDGETAGNATSQSHRFLQPGLFNVRASVTNPTGTRVCQLQHSVYQEPTSIRPNSATTILFDDSSNRVWNVNPDNDTVSASSASTLSKLSETPVGDKPRTLAKSPAGDIWVVNETSATISVLDASTGVVQRSIDLPRASRPYGIVFNPIRNEAYVSLQATGTILRLNGTTGQTIAETGGITSARGLAISADGATLYVSRFISPQDQGELYEMDATTLEVTRTIPLAHDPGPDTPESGRGVPNGLGSPVISPDGERLLIPSKKDNTQRGAALDGQTHTFESTLRSIVSHVDIASGSELLAERRDLNNSDTTTAVALNSRGDIYFVATQGTRTVDVFHRYSNERLVAIENVGLAPQGLVLSPDNSRLFVHGFLSRSVEVYDISEISNLGSTTSQHLASINTVSSEALAPSVLAGKQIFYEAKSPNINQETYIACATCHLDERDDGRNWERSGFGEGMRNTISLLGHGRADQGRLHWSANFDEVQDFEHDMRGQFGGQGFLTDEQFATGTTNHPLGAAKSGLTTELDQLADYLASLQSFPDSPYRLSTGELTPLAESGRTVFAAAGCADCHHGTGFSDGLMHDVGTLGALSGMRLGTPLLGIETPTLLGLWETAPYLHDGSAENLTQLLTRHNNNSTLSTSDRNALVAYLMQLDDSEPAPPLVAAPIQLNLALAQAEVGETIAISADVMPTLGPVDTVRFYANGQLVSQDSSAPHSANWQPDSAGNYLISAVAVHANGYTTAARNEVVVAVTVP